MNVSLPYGKKNVDIDLDGVNATVLEPKFVKGVADEKAGFLAACEAPIGSAPLKHLIGSEDKVAILIPDATRPFPSDRVLPWLFEALSHVSKERVVIINGTGSHRGNTPEELIGMVGQGIYDAYRIINHDAHDPSTLAYAGKSEFGYDVYQNREYVEADKRILMGFIEPHFMAGFSGGYKAAFPGVACVDSIMKYHSAMVVGDPLSSWGNLKDNPTQEHVRAGGRLVGADFLVNVTLNRDRAITRFFCGDVIEAHEQGCTYVKESAMVGCKKAFPIVVTSNNGFPLDQNLYQAVKGMSAAAQIVEEGGLILVAAECADGFPDHGNYRKLLFDYPDPDSLLEAIRHPDFAVFDQWQVQLQALICQKARVAIQCSIDGESLKKAHLIPVESVDVALKVELRRIGQDTPIAVLPEGPVTVPYLK
ncbi:MAG: nickel-dependent lactate racemase [Opitutales bacterium]|jgi:nickel-dependent lactate racemase|nr:nickel-dependent lactate racemase [Opitutales bacterium]MBT5167014.1 nickel-dependent lactate racemase [Opitutales bacterium]MBT5815994.1 nickel-dependent lactate racemase [Opitutales bacterium]MBT6379888.1 nickel-dependent lactate racemase [Opitutales bacterium]MBT6770678.1 nickel-dependent lactate racemase [Opitutales bacterium]